MRAVAREIVDLEKDVNRIVQPFEGSFDPARDPATACALLVDHISMRRNKRCLLAYHRVRAEKLEHMCWEGKDVLDQTYHGAGGSGDMTGRANESSLSPEEEEYFRQYSDMLSTYKGQWTDIDLTGSLEPPHDLFVDVRVLKDAGEIQTEYGWVKRVVQVSVLTERRSITLSKNSQFYVRLADVERLIQQGFLQRLN